MGNKASHDCETTEQEIGVLNDELDKFTSGDGPETAVHETETQISTPLSFANEYYISIAGLKDAELLTDPPARKTQARKRQDKKEKAAHGLATGADSHVYALITISFLLLDLVLLFLFVWVLVPCENALPKEDTSEGHPVALEDSAFCLPCDQVYFNKHEIQQNRFNVKVHIDTNICCEKPHSDLEDFIKTIYLTVRYQTDRATGQIRFSNETDGEPESSSAHNLKLSVPVTKRPWTDLNGLYPVPLEITPDSAEGNVMPYAQHKDTLMVWERGVYYIYSQVPFKYSDKMSANKTQYVYRIRNGGEDLLLENSVYPCEASHHGCMQSFVGGTFVLEDGDRLGLRVSNHECLDENGKVEFGIHRV